MVTEKNDCHQNGGMEKVGWLGVNSDSRWAQYSRLETSKLEMVGTVKEDQEGKDY